MLGGIFLLSTNNCNMRIFKALERRQMNGGRGGKEEVEGYIEQAIGEVRSSRNDEYEM